MKKLSIYITAFLLSVSLFAATNDNDKAASAIDSTLLEKQDLTKSEYFTREYQTKEIIDTSHTFGNPQVAMAQSDYYVTAGDVYLLTYAAGTSAVSYYITVDPTYKIRVSNLGVIDAAGKTFVAVKKQVEEIVTRNYPLSGMQFVLTTPAKFKVIIKGEVTQTVEATAWALTRVSTLVNQVKTEYSSIRNVKITSANGTEKTYDLFDAERNGNMNNDPFVAPGDVITLQRAERVVNISGAVERPGIYQLLPGENVEKLINYYANGLTVTGDEKHIEVSRIRTASSTAGEKIYLDSIKKDNEFELCNFDIVNVTSFYEMQPVMFLQGAVGEIQSGTALETSTRIPMQFYPNTNYAYFIRQNSKYFKSNVSDNQNAYVQRGSDIFPVNINKALYDNSFVCDLIVQEDDILVVPFKQYFVTVAGAVRNPGRYPYIPDRTYDYYVALAGGFIPMQNAFKSVDITDGAGKKVKKNSYITPECQIVAKSNHFAYVIVTYGGLITSIATLITNIFQLKSLTGM